MGLTIINLFLFCPQYILIDTFRLVPCPKLICKFYGEHLQSSIHCWAIFTPKLLCQNCMVFLSYACHYFSWICHDTCASEGRCFIRGHACILVIRLVEVKQDINKNWNNKISEFLCISCTLCDDFKTTCSLSPSVIDIIFPICGNRKPYESFPDRNEGWNFSNRFLRTSGVRAYSNWVVNFGKLASQIENFHPSYQLNGLKCLMTKMNSVTPSYK